jgi:hypothetical protein
MDASLLAVLSESERLLIAETDRPRSRRLTKTRRSSGGMATSSVQNPSSRSGSEAGDRPDGGITSWGLARGK